MSTDDINTRIAKRVRELRQLSPETIDSLASKSGVSRSMISLIERAEANPTAAILEKLAAGLGVSMAALFESEETADKQNPLVRRADQALWRDPESGYIRRTLSPPNWPSSLHLAEIHFPAGSSVTYEASGRKHPLEQQIWVLQGQIEITHGSQQYSLKSGDCLALRFYLPMSFSNPHSQATKYLVAIGDETLAYPMTGRDQ